MHHIMIIEYGRFNLLNRTNTQQFFNQTKWKNRTKGKILKNKSDLWIIFIEQMRQYELISLLNDLDCHDESNYTIQDCLHHLSIKNLSLEMFC